jgi:hypothetical protein
MKKLIAISVVFALVAGVAFAVDVTGTVFGHVNVLEGSTAEDSKVTASGGMDRVRIDGSGEAGDGLFGGYVRFQYGNKKYFEPVTWNEEGVNETGADFNLLDSANAWWKPIDQFKLIIGNNSDGIWGKEGVTGWGFNQMPNDSSVASNYGIWYGNGWGSSIYDGGANKPLHNRYTFFEGVVDYGALMEITPVDMFGVNLFVPFIRDAGKEAGDVFQAAVAQINVNLDFGNIAITYDGGGRAVTVNGDKGAIFAYFGGTFGDLGIDFGVSYHLDDTDDEADVAHPIGIGVGVKYATESFGVKFRTTAALAGDDEKTYINVSVLPFFNISDNMAAFVNAGLGMIMQDPENEMGWYFNPYLRVGAEWGPSFYVGVKVESPFKGAGDSIINFSVPIALMVSF